MAPSTNPFTLLRADGRISLPAQFSNSLLHSHDALLQSTMPRRRQTVTRRESRLMLATSSVTVDWKRTVPSTLCPRYYSRFEMVCNCSDSYFLLIASKQSTGCPDNTGYPSPDLCRQMGKEGSNRLGSAPTSAQITATGGPLENRWFWTFLRADKATGRPIEFN